MDSLFDALLAGSLAANPDGSSVNYNNISNKPQINGVTLSGNKTSSDLSLATSAQGEAADTAIQSFKIDSGSELKSGTSVNVTSMPASILTGDIADGVTATTQSAGDKSNKVATTDYVDTAIENLPEPMIFEGSITLTADSSDTTKCSITVSAPSSTSNIKKGFTYKITSIAVSPAYTGTLKVGDTLIAAKAAPTVSSSWVQDTDWTVVPSGDETGYILGKASGTTQNDLVKWGADGFTVEDAGVSIETSAISNSDTKIPTSKSIKTNVAKTSVIDGFTPVTTPTAHQTPATTDTINQALAKIDNNQRLNETNILSIQQTIGDINSVLEEVL